MGFRLFDDTLAMVRQAVAQIQTPAYDPIAQGDASNFAPGWDSPSVPWVPSPAEMPAWNAGFPEPYQPFYEPPAPVAPAPTYVPYVPSAAQFEQWNAPLPMMTAPAPVNVPYVPNAGQFSQWNAGIDPFAPPPMDVPFVPSARQFDMWQPEPANQGFLGQLQDFGGDVLSFPSQAWDAVQAYDQSIQDRARQQMFDEGGLSFWDQLTGGGGERIFNATGYDTNQLPGILPDVVDATASPATLLTAGVGQAAGQSLRLSPALSRFAPLVEPVIGGNAGRAFLGETAVNTGAIGAGALAEEYLPESTPFRDPLIMGAQLLGGGGAAAALQPSAIRRTPVLSAVEESPTLGQFDVNPEFRAATDAILEGVRRESNIRRAGIATREIAEGRTRQASGISDMLAAGRAEGLSGEDLAVRARSGAATGTLRQTFAEPIALDQAQRGVVFDELANMLDRGELRQFEYMTAVKATQKLLNGDGLQPAEIRLLRNVFGEEVASAVTDRPMSAAAQFRQEMKDIERGRAFEAKLAERRKQEAALQLQRENRRMAILQERIDKRETSARATAAERAAREGTADPIRSDADLRRLNEIRTASAAAMKAVNDADELEIAQGRRLQGEIAERAEREKARTQQAANVRGLREAEHTDRVSPNTEMLRRKAEEMIGESWPSHQAIRREGVRAIDLWLRQNDVLLDSITPEGERELLGAITSAVRGDTANSFVTTLLHRKNILVSALANAGYERDVAQKVANQLVKMELQSRYRGAIPPEVEALLKEATQPASNVVRGAADLSQEFKNTMFGIADVGVFGQQVTSALGTGGIPALVGLVNKVLSTLHLPHVNTLYADVALPKMTQYELDGVPQNMLTGVVSDLERTGTMVRLLGKPGQWADRALVVPVVDALQSLQFKSVMTPLRNTIYEGNLVMAHLARQDITNPQVRATAAENASAITSAGKLSPRAGRATAEKGLLLSPSMTRAQVQLITQMARVFSPRATIEERLVGATAIASSVTSVLTVGYYLNDLVGVGDFEMDPSKSAFGKITLPNGTVIDLFPQKQVVKAFAQSVRALADREPGEAAEAWGKLGLGRLSPVAGVAAKAAGFGFETGEGYKFGDYGTGSGAASKILNLAPVPPVLGDLLRGDLSVETLPWKIAGFGAYEESPYAARDRKLINDPRFGKPFADLNDRGLERDAIEAYGDVEFEKPKIPVETQVDIGFENLKRANAEAEATLAQKLGASWAPSRETRDAVSAFNEERALAWDVAIGPDLEKWLDAHKDEPGTVREMFATKYYAVEMPTLPNGEPDFDTFYAERDKVLAEARAAGVDLNYITGRGVNTYRGEQFTNPAVREAVEEVESMRASIRESGYWDLRDRAWQELNAQAPAPGYQSGMSYDEYKQMVIDEAVAGGVPAFDAEEVAMARHPVLSKFSDAYKRMYLYPWVDSHPEVTWQLVEWEYLNPDEKVERFLVSQGYGQ